MALLLLLEDQTDGNGKVRAASLLELLLAMAQRRGR